MDKEKVYIADLRPGMYVYELDRPWLDTPFLLQGFLIQEPEQIEELGRHCEFVYIDPLKSTAQALAARRGGPAPAPSPVAEGMTPTGKPRHPYPEQTTTEEELNEALPLRRNLAELANALREGVRSGKMMEVEQFKGAVAAMVDSVIRNPNALLLLSRLKEKDEGAYGYAVDVAICLLAFGRHLGLSPDELQYLGQGGMLLDIGKVRLPDALLAKKGLLTGEEHRLMKAHVQHSVDIVKAMPDIAPEVLEMVAMHHEREDGSGYPGGLAAETIGIYGKMAGIVDCFQDLVTDRPYAPPMAPHVALQMLHQWRGRLFPEYLVDEFIRCLGVYPVGSLVELNSGEVAVVAAQTARNRLRPRVLVVLDRDKQPLPAPAALDLSTGQAGQVMREIVRGLEPGMYGINPKAYFS